VSVASAIGPARRGAPQTEDGETSRRSAFVPLDRPGVAGMRRVRIFAELALGTALAAL